ncbi:hypothetical protein GURKE_02840 [Brevundimonas phage vB_BpoS-Gurke]|uniref:DUF7831 domain-containing protein n=1 Tax=Brevundimonas phage vB_BpoS-Gurke TaxID=2948599 RepID=A0A9E7N3Q9_9CAUD|nr:hypothetical protein GURKE_02840 [Brevundimonas phage vB_BpoS-Gurke]
MPVLFQTIIKRTDLVRNRDVLYVFGDNVQRRGFGGQAREMRREPNAVGIVTKLTPELYFGNTPEEVVAQNRMIDEDMKPLFAKVKAGGVVVWPADGVGTGLAQLSVRAPRTFDYLSHKLAALLKAADLFNQETPDGAGH